MGGCRICGGMTRRASRLCRACDADLDDYETLDSRTADLLIPVRRYGCASVAARAAHPPQPPASQGSRRLVLSLACVALAGALALAALVAW